jgi:hypothetical protein
MPFYTLLEVFEKKSLVVPMYNFPLSPIIKNAPVSGVICQIFSTPALTYYLNVHVLYHQRYEHKLLTSFLVPSGKLSCDCFPTSPAFLFTLVTRLLYSRGTMALQ